MLFNSHGGQPQVMDIVARDLRVRLGLLVVAYSWYAAGLPPGLFPDHEVRHGIHAGAIETSMMLHLRPDLVRMERAADFAPLMAEMAAHYRLLSPTGPGRLAWQAQDLHPSGACGDATNADAERGRRLVEHAAQALVGLARGGRPLSARQSQAWPGGRLMTAHRPCRDAAGGRACRCQVRIRSSWMTGHVRSD